MTDCTRGGLADEAGLAIRQGPATKIAASLCDHLTMFGIENPLVWGVGGVVFAGACVLLWRHFCAEARERRRRARSHGKVVSSRHGPLVRLVVETEQPKDDGRG